MANGTAAAVILGVAVSLGFLGFMLVATDGHVVPQVADLYLVCQYAKAMAEGHPFQYNPGEPGSTGATSLLHTATLALAHRLGAHGEALVAVAIALGVAYWLCSIALACRIGRRLAGPREGNLAGLLLALSGPVAWGFHYGSDIGLFMVLCLWLLDGLLAAGEDPGRLGRAVAPATLLALARPEGLVIALGLLAFWLLGPARSPRERGLALLPTLAALAVLGLNRAATGSWLGTSLADKSLLAAYGLPEALAVVSEYVVDFTRGVLFGFYPSVVPVGLAQGFAPYYFPPLALLLAGLAVVTALPPWRTPLRVFCAIAVAVGLLLTPNLFLGVHFNRYLMWAFPPLHVLSAVGLSWFTRRLAGEQEELERALFRAGAALALFLGLFSTARFAVQYGEMAGTIYRRDVAAARWIQANLPPGVPMANLATSVEFLTGHRNLNLHGVTSPAFFGNQPAEREADVFEALTRLSPAERPPYLISTAGTQEALVSMRALTVEPPLFETSSYGDEIVILRTRWDLLGRNLRHHLPSTAAAVEGMREVDRLNICDTLDEAAHGYEFSSRLGDLRLNGAVRIESYPGGELVGDAGRAIIGWERFTVRTEPGRDLMVVLRTAPDVNATLMRAAGKGQMLIAFPEAGMVVAAGGTTVGRTTFPPGAGWDERVFRVPASALTGPRTELTLTGRYPSFHYWFYQ